MWNFGMFRLDFSSTCVYSGKRFNDHFHSDFIGAALIK